MVRVRMFETETIKIIDRSGAISTSKIRKIIVIKKNRSEKEVVRMGNGEHFSRSARAFLDKVDASKLEDARRC